MISFALMVSGLSLNQGSRKEGAEYRSIHDRWVKKSPTLTMESGWSIALAPIIIL